jgi:hypothetical protein
MYDLLGSVLKNLFFFLIILMSVHNSAKFQQCSVIFAKPAVDTKIRLFSATARFFCGHCIIDVEGIYETNIPQDQISRGQDNALPVSSIPVRSVSLKSSMPHWCS